MGVKKITQNLHSEHLILHIWSVWVGTQLKQLLSGVPYALGVNFFGSFFVFRAPNMTHKASETPEINRFS